MTNSSTITATDLTSWTADQLFQRFSDIALADADVVTIDPSYDNGVSPEGIAERGRLFFLLQATSDALRQHGPAARRQLLALYDHPRAWVRLRAAQFSYAVAPAEARAVLTALSTNKIGLIRLNAGMNLDNIDSGVWVPE